MSDCAAFPCHLRLGLSWALYLKGIGDICTTTVLVEPSASSLILRCLRHYYGFGVFAHRDSYPQALEWKYNSNSKGPKRTKKKEGKKKEHGRTVHDRAMLLSPAPNRALETDNE